MEKNEFSELGNFIEEKAKKIPELRKRLKKFEKEINLLLNNNCGIDLPCVRLSKEPYCDSLGWESGIFSTKLVFIKHGPVDVDYIRIDNMSYSQLKIANDVINEMIHVIKKSYEK